MHRRRCAAVRFELASQTEVNLRVYDASGRAVRTLFRGALPTGEHAVLWTGENEHGQVVPAGIYFLEFRAGAVVEARRLAVVP